MHAVPADFELPAQMVRPRLRFMTCGSVDDGKSTLIGRLLYDSNAIFEDHLLEVVRATGNSSIDFSFFVDGLKAEREQGITIDVAYRYFHTQHRAFLIADAPGHEQYTRNQAAAASQAQLAVVLVSADDGVRLQTRRHMALASLFGVRNIILAVNKMDRVDWNIQRYKAVRDELASLAVKLGQTVSAAIPLSATHGDNVVRSSANSDWYDGPTLLQALEQIVVADTESSSAILPVQVTGRLHGGGRVSFGTLAGGSLRVGQTVHSDKGLSAKLVKLWDAGIAVDSVESHLPVAVALTPELDLGRGAVLFSEHSEAGAASQLRVRLIWLQPQPPKPGAAYDIQIATGQSGATLSRIDGVLDLVTLNLTPLEGALALNDIAVARLTLSAPLAAMPFSEQRTLGACILVDRASRNTVASGVVLSVDKRFGDTPWQTLQINPVDRARIMGQEPVVIWLTGLSGAGKSTIANLVDRHLHRDGRHAMVLDGDNLRHGLSSDLGFSEADRVENIRRVAHVAALAADAGLIVIVSLISPFIEAREAARDIIGRNRFLEVFVDAPLDVCQQRDPKGMYARAIKGGLQQFTGVAAGYEPPLTPYLHLQTDQISAEDAAEQVIAALAARKNGH
ncbi:MAG: adenylyl-sulfate kinase [Beijerinckiaceae bacterium]